MRKVNVLSLKRYDDNDLLDQSEVAGKIFGLKDARALNHYRSQGKFDCPYYRISGSVFYKVSDLRKWFLKDRIDPREIKEKAMEVKR